MSQYQPMYDSFRRTPNEGYVPSARMSVSATVQLPSSEVDLYTGQLKPDYLRRRRTQAKRVERQELDARRKREVEAIKREEGKGGVRISMRLGVLVIAAVLFLCGMTVLYQLGQIAYWNGQTTEVNETIALYTQANQKLDEQIQAGMDVTAICYTASQKLGMIPSDQVHAIHLVAVDTRPIKAPQHSVVVTAQTQNTPVPMIASN